MRYRFTDCMLDTATREVLRGSEPVHVDRQVFDVLAYLVEHADRVVTKEELLDAVWGGQFVTESAMTTRIKTARRAVGDDGTRQAVIRTIRGVGYRLVAAVDSEQAASVPSSPHDGAPADESAVPADRRRPSLPSYATSLVGREDELASLRPRVRPGALVTIVGIGGAGKTRLAIELASRWADDWPDGVIFVDLAAVTEELLVAVGALAAIGVEEEPSRPPLRTLQRVMTGCRALIVLDNAEHVISGASSLIEALRQAAPDSAIVVTSREPTRVRGEHVWPLGPLAADDADGPAVRLLLDRAAAANPAQTLGPVAVELARKLGGLPLAIEMVAPWTRTLSPSDLRDQLHEVLSIGDRGLPPRQRTMTAVLASSDRLLDPATRTAFHRLGACSGGFDLAAALAVIDQGPDGLGSLARLVDSCLVEAHTQAGATRYRLLEPVRQYALAQLVADGQEEAARHRHLAHYLAVARDIGRHTNRPDQREWFARADADLPNLRAAHDWALRSGAAEEAVRLAVGLHWYWWIRAASTEGLERLRRSLALGPSQALAARAHVANATMLLQAGRRSAALQEARRALTAAEAVGDTRVQALANGSLARMLADLGRLTDAAAALDRAQAIYDAEDNTRGLAWLAMVRLLTDGDIHRTAARLRGLLPQLEADGNRWGLAWAWAILGHARARDDDVDTARELLTKALAEIDAEEFRDELVVMARSWLAVVLVRLREPAEALRHLRDGLRACDAFPDRLPLDVWTWALAEVAAARDDRTVLADALAAHDVLRTSAATARERLDPQRIAALRRLAPTAPGSRTAPRPGTTPTVDELRHLLRALEEG